MGNDKLIPSKHAEMKGPFTNGKAYARVPIHGVYNRMRRWGNWAGGFASRSNDSDRSFRDYFDVVVRRWLPLTIFLAASVIASIVYILFVTPTYKSQARLEVSVKRNIFSKVPVRRWRMFSQRYVESQVWILKSRMLAESLVTRMNLLDNEDAEDEIQQLVEVRSSLPKRIKAWLKEELSLGVANDQNVQRIAILGEALARTVDAKRVGATSGRGNVGTNLIDVSISATSPELANHFLSVYVHTYIDKNLERTKQRAIRVEKWLREERSRTEEKLREAQAKLSDFSVKRGLVVATEAPFATVMEALNEKIQGQMQAEESKQRALALQDSNLAGSGLTTKEAANTLVNRLKLELANHEAEYSKNQAVYAPGHPSMVLLSRKIKFLGDRISEIERDIASGEAEVADKMYDFSRESVEESKKDVSQVRAVETEYLILKREVEAKSELLSQITREMHEMAILARTKTNNIFIVDPPTVPRDPSSPNKPLTLGLGLAIGLIGGLCCAFFRENMDQTLRRPEDIPSSLALQRLGAVPDLSRIGVYRQSELSEGTVEFLAYYRPNTVISDALQNIETSIFFANSNLNIRCFSVSSSLPSEGKTFIAVSLASLLCKQGGRRVAIVDLDMRKPRIQSVFGANSATAGMSNILACNDDTVTLTDITRTHGIPGLHYITAGPVPPDPVQLLHSANLEKIVTALRDTFDFVVIDCPPILGFPDTPMISRFTDGLVMVARQGYVSKQEIALALNHVRSVEGANVLGVVFNRVHTSGIYNYMRKFGYRYGGGANSHSLQRYYQGPRNRV